MWLLSKLGNGHVQSFLRSNSAIPHARPHRLRTERPLSGTGERHPMSPKVTASEPPQKSLHDNADAETCCYMDVDRPAHSMSPRPERVKKVQRCKCRSAAEC